MRAFRILFAGVALACIGTAQDTPPAPPPAPPWHFGLFSDMAYIVDFNHPANHLFKDRATTFKVDELDLNMAGIWIRKDASTQSRWGMEATLHLGKDSQEFGFSATAPNLPGSRWLRHLGPTDVSYLAPVGKGLTVQAGIFNSLIGYDSLYAKDNPAYTRPWGADFTPYLMMGVNVSYPFTSTLTGTFALVNGYAHLADANHVPSSSGQLAYKPHPNVTLKQTLFYGPHQADTSLEFWRFLSDSIVEWKRRTMTAAFEYQIAAERVAEPGRPRALWTAAQLPLHWDPLGPWNFYLRPEFAWDREGRWTSSPQFVKAISTTIEYRVPYRKATAMVRLEHRYDNSHGRGGGFFKDGFSLSPGTPEFVLLTPSQHLLSVALILTWESSLHR